MSVPDLDSGGVLVLRFNNTGSAVNKEIQVGLDKFKILFGESEGTIFAASISGLTLNIGGVVTIEGDVTFTSQGEYKVFAGNNITLFIGEGNLRLDDGKLNPFAKGLMITEATIGLVKQGDGGAVKYALSATGQVAVVGISELSLSGPISINYNGFDQLIDQTVAIACLLYTSPSPRD